MSTETPANPPGPGVGIPQQPPAPAADTTISEALITIRKRRLLIIAFGVLGLLYGFYKGITQIRLYDTYGRIEVREGSSNEFKLSSSGSFFDDDPQRKMQTEVAILTSDTLLATVARDLNLANNPDFLGAKGPVAHRNLEDPAVRQGVVGQLQGSLKVSVVPKTDIIRIEYSSLNGKLSADIINRLISDYQLRSYETRYLSTQRVSQFLSSQLEGLKRDVETDQNKVLELGRQLGTLGFDPTHNQIASSLDDLVKAQAQAKLARILAESRYRLLAAQDPNSIESTLDAIPGAPQGELTTLRTQLATAEAAYSKNTAIYKDRNPLQAGLVLEIKTLKQEIAAEESRLLTEAREAYLLTKANEDQTSAVLDQQKNDAYKLRDAQVAFTIAQRQFEANRTLYEGLLDKLRTAGIEAGLESLEIDIVDQAQVPVSPTLQPRGRIAFTYAALGVVCGIILAFVLESLDSSLRSVAEIESITELPSLAIIPRARRATAEQLAGLSAVDRNITVLTQPKSQFTEAFRSLRTALLLSTPGREPKYILFTSATPSEGKTTAATNLAVILAQRGTRVLLIDADLRRPNIHHRFNLNGKLGLSTVLSGQSTLADSVQRVAEVPTLDILSSGPVPPFPTEMLASETMSNLLRHCGELYTHVVLDSPPILSVTDGVLLSRMVDAVLIVVRHGKSSKHIVRRGRDLLARSNAPLAGIVLNAVDLNAPEYYGYYGYSGYSYASLDPAGWDATGTGQPGSGAAARSSSEGSRSRRGGSKGDGK